METGVPELGLPPLDPMTIEEIGFKFYNVTSAFTNTKLRGFKDFKLESSKVDKQKRFNNCHNPNSTSTQLKVGCDTKMTLIHHTPNPHKLNVSNISAVTDPILMKL